MRHAGMSLAKTGIGRASSGTGHDARSVGMDNLYRLRRSLGQDLLAERATRPVGEQALHCGWQIRPLGDALSEKATFPPCEVAKSQMIDPGFIDNTISSLIIKGAFFPGIKAVVITTS